MSSDKAIRRFALSQLSLCVGLACSSMAVWAQTAPVADTLVAQAPVGGVLKEVVVSGSRVEQDIDEVPATITTISAEKMRRENPTDLQDLMKDEAGVSVRALPYRGSMGGNIGRGGNEGINIRGLEGDQVRLQIDGVSLPSSYDSGPNYASRGEYLDPEGYKRVEILRGASGTQYGSDGLAGTVSFVTKDPQDLLTLGKSTQFNFKTGYNSVDNSWQVAPSFAFKGDTVQGLVLASRRRGHETENMGTNSSANATRTTPNPLEAESNYVLAKLVLSPDATHQVKLTAESIRKETNAEVLSARSATVADFDARDLVSRDLAKLDYRYAPGSAWFDILTASLYFQSSETRQYHYERNVSTNLRSRDTRYGEDATGASVQMETNFGKDVTHRLVYGAEFVYRDVTSFKDGSNGSLAAFTPNKAFPDTDYLTLGAFVQDEIGVGKIAVTPGVRFDAFRLNPRNDSYYAASGAPTAPTELSGSQVSPRLGMIWKLDPMATPFAQYAHGFRAPRPTDVNGAFSNIAQGYTSVTNPDLKPETSDSLEIGLRGRDSTLRYSVSAFHAKYQDFISQQIVSGGGTPANPNVYKTINLPDVTISGFEARGDWTYARGWTASAAYAHAYGTSKNTNGTTTPLATIDPDKLMLGLGYAEGAQWGANTRLTAVSRKGSTAVTPGSYAVVDMAGWYQVSKAVFFQAGVRNLFDKKYTQWADVRNLTLTAANVALVDSYTQPGRNFNVSMTYSF
jgi:hemoglobin/transferrin/lactoferrin receptor protein